MTICRERGNIFKQSASRSFTSEISGLRKQYGMRGWRNWQTRTFEVRVVYPWGFESPPSHQKPVHIVCWFFFLCEGGDLEQGGGIYAASKATVRLCLACGCQPVGMSNKRTTVHPGKNRTVLKPVKHIRVLVFLFSVRREDSSYPFLFFIQMRYSPSVMRVSRYRMGVQHACRMGMGRLPVA